jgi:flagellar assembly protein FliH
MDIVKTYNGLKKVEEEEYEEKIKSIVDDKLNKIKNDWIKIGKEEGSDQGKKEFEDKVKKMVEQSKEEISSFIEEIKSFKNSIYQKQKNEVVDLIKNVTKYVILRELKNDDEFISRLFERMLYEVDTKDNLILRVNSKKSQIIKNTLDSVRIKFLEVNNIRIEDDHTLDANSIILESAFGIIDGSMNAQFEYIDKIAEELKTEVH